MRNARERIGLALCLGLAAAAFLTGPAAADSEDLNPVFAPMTELPRAALDGANGKGVEDVAQNATLIVNGTQDGGAALSGLPDLSGQFTGNNAIDAGAFSGSQVFAAIVQNNGSFVNIQNLLAVEVNMAP